MTIHPGELLAGYRVTRLLGRGGMGEVWAARPASAPVDDTSTAHADEVAVKLLLARAAVKPELVRRFAREAAAVSAIKSPFVCQLLDAGQTSEGAHFLVFQRLLGESLAERLKREPFLPFDEVGHILDDVLQGLGAAHAAGVVHRDLKPGNIFLSERPPKMTAPVEERPPARRERAVLLDFGISKLTRRAKADVTLTGFDATLGSVAYMAPEQIHGAAGADERADVYAVGAVAFRALVGRLPFHASSAHAVIRMKLERDAPSLSEATGERWPAAIERFLARALARDRAARFATAGEAHEAWRAILPTGLVDGEPSVDEVDGEPIPRPMAGAARTQVGWGASAAFEDGEDEATEVDENPPAHDDADGELSVS